MLFVVKSFCLGLTALEVAKNKIFINEWFFLFPLEPHLYDISLKNPAVTFGDPCWLTVHLVINHLDDATLVHTIVVCFSFPERNYWHLKVIFLCVQIFIWVRANVIYFLHFTEFFHCLHKGTYCLLLAYAVGTKLKNKVVF